MDSSQTTERQHSTRNTHVPRKYYELSTGPPSFKQTTISARTLESTSPTYEKCSFGTKKPRRHSNVKEVEGRVS
jgi:hypothetical protein